MTPIFNPTTKNQNYEQDNYEKGRLFEQFIVELFNKDFFYPVKWRKSEKFTDTFFPIDHYNPDLEIELVFKGAKKYRFAVECKWRKEFKQEKIEWANDSQICSYRIFQDRVRIPVFIAIGIGGEPSSPERLFVTPLNNLEKSCYVSQHELIPYKRRPSRKFYFDIVQLNLF